MENRYSLYACQDHWTVTFRTSIRATLAGVCRKKWCGEAVALLEVVRRSPELPDLLRRPCRRFYYLCLKPHGPPGQSDAGYQRTRSALQNDCEASEVLHSTRRGDFPRSPYL